MAVDTSHQFRFLNSDEVLQAKIYQQRCYGKHVYFTWKRHASGRRVDNTPYPLNFFVLVKDEG